LAVHETKKQTRWKLQKVKAKLVRVNKLGFTQKKMEYQTEVKTLRYCWENVFWIAFFLREFSYDFTLGNKV